MWLAYLWIRSLFFMVLSTIRANPTTEQQTVSPNDATTLDEDVDHLAGPLLGERKQRQERAPDDVGGNAAIADDNHVNLRGTRGSHDFEVVVPRLFDTADDRVGNADRHVDTVLMAHPRHFLTLDFRLAGDTLAASNISGSHR
jgi:hypothetical protein